jgi:hypothetical protein
MEANGQAEHCLSKFWSPSLGKVASIQLFLLASLKNYAARVKHKDGPVALRCCRPSKLQYRNSPSSDRLP